MAATEKEYRDLNERIRKLEQNRAVLQAQEQVRQNQRDVLVKDLAAAGIDVNNLDAERARLEREINEEFERAKAEVDEFEKALNELTKEETNA